MAKSNANIENLKLVIFTSQNQQEIIDTAKQLLLTLITGQSNDTPKGNSGAKRGPKPGKKRGSKPGPKPGKRRGRPKATQNTEG